MEKLEKKCKEKNQVIAISGMPGSGKTTVSQNLLNQYNDFVYFDFGFLFRPLTYYLMNELNLDENEIKLLVDNDLLKDKLIIGYQIKNNIVEISINTKFYDFDKLNTPEMNINTVTIGSIIGDSLNKELEKIIDDLKKNNNVLLNARRPVAVYPNLDKHIFLKCSFEERVKRKSLMNKEEHNTTEKKLFNRDKKEINSGFWKIYDFSKVVDTTFLSEKEVFNKVIGIIDNRGMKLNNLTLVLGSYECDKNCPYCIAKNNKKFLKNDNELQKLSDILTEFDRNNINFDKFVLSGNGEPSLYTYEQLEFIKETIMKNRQLFNKIRVHTSGNIFFKEQAFHLFNNIILPVEFEVLRVDLSSKVDKKVLGYNRDYLTSELFAEANEIKCDIAFTDYLNTEDLKNRLDEFLYKHNSIKKIRFKKLLVGDKDVTPQACWVKKHGLSDLQIEKVINQLGLISTSEGYISSNHQIIYKENGNYSRDLVINNNNINDYDRNILSCKQLIKKYGVNYE